MPKARRVPCIEGTWSQQHRYKGEAQHVRGMGEAAKSGAEGSDLPK